MRYEGDRPGGAPPAPRPVPNPGPPRFCEMPAADQNRIIEIFRPGFERALARWQERKRLAAQAAETEHVKAA